MNDIVVHAMFGGLFYICGCCKRVGQAVTRASGASGPPDGWDVRVGAPHTIFGAPDSRSLYVACSEKCGRWIDETTVERPFEKAASSS